MERFGAPGTPALVWKDSAGKVRVKIGMPRLSQLPAITGLPAQKNDDPAARGVSLRPDRRAWRRSARAPGFIAEFELPPALRAATGLGLTRGVGDIPPRALLLRSLRPIARSELDFKLVELIPLRFGPPRLRYREELLQALTRGSRLRRIHGGVFLCHGKHLLVL